MKTHCLFLLSSYVTTSTILNKSYCHRFVTLLLVFHIITSWTKEKNYVSQRTSRSEKEDTSRKIRHLVAHGLSLSVAVRERSGCAFQAGRLHQVRLSVSETLSLSLPLPLYRSFALSLIHLVYYPYSQLDCIVLCHLVSQHHS